MKKEKNGIFGHMVSIKVLIKILGFLFSKEGSKVFRLSEEIPTKQRRLSGACFKIQVFGPRTY